MHSRELSAETLDSLWRRRRKAFTCPFVCKWQQLLLKRRQPSPDPQGDVQRKGHAPVAGIPSSSCWLSFLLFQSQGALPPLFLYWGLQCRINDSCQKFMENKVTASMVPQVLLKLVHESQVFLPDFLWPWSWDRASLLGAQLCHGWHSTSMFPSTPRPGCVKVAKSEEAN